MFLFRSLGLTLLDDSRYGYHKKLRFVNLSWMLIHIAVFIFLVVSPSSLIFSRNYSRMSEIIEMANYLFALVTVLVILAHVQIVMKLDRIWHENLLELDRLLHDNFCVKINHETNGHWRLLKILITFIGACACSAVNTHYAVTNDPQSDRSVLLLFTHNYFLKAVINLRYIQNFIRIDFLKHRIHAVHEAVRNAVELNTIEWKIVLVVDSSNRRHISPAKKIDDVNNVLLFKRFYATLFESMKLLESCFGWSLLVMISFTFVDLTSNLYWFFIAILQLNERVFVLDCVLEITPSVVTICCLIYSSFDANRKAKEVINSIMKLFTNTTSCYNKMLKEFLMQIHHESIEFSANDFFIVDFHLFSAVSSDYYHSLELHPPKPR